MLNWFAENAGTIVVSMGLAVLVALIIRGMVRDHKAGRNSCGNACSHCPMSKACRRRKVQQPKRMGSC